VNKPLSGFKLWLAITLGVATILMASGSGCARQRRVNFISLRNGDTIQGEVRLPINVCASNLDGIFLTANGGPISGSIQIQTNDFGKWFVDWDTQKVPNGIYDICLEADSGNQRFLSSSKTITVSNMISFDSFPFYGDQMWMFARLAVSCAKWKIKVFSDEGKYIGYFAGTTTNGLINFI
jgi:hypothetical protein